MIKKLFLMFLLSVVSMMAIGMTYPETSTNTSIINSTIADDEEEECPYELLTDGDTIPSGVINEVRSFSTYAVYLPEEYLLSQIMGGVYYCFLDEETGATFVTRSADAGNMNVQELADIEFEVYPGETHEMWNNGRSYVCKLSENDDMTFLCMATVIDKTAYFGCFGISTKVLDENMEWKGNYLNMVACSMANFPMLANN